VKGLLLLSQLLSIGLVSLISVAAPAQPIAPTQLDPPTNLGPINFDRAEQGMVTSAHPLATQTGLQILQQGGNAVDAAVATTLAISVVEPFSAGIGGGGFMLLHQAKTGEITALDFRERAPLRATRDMYRDAQGKVIPQLSTNGHLAVAVPGTVAGLYEAQQRYGKLPWKQVVQPAIGLAEKGFPVSWRFQQALTWGKAVIDRHPEAQRIFLPQGEVPKIGDRLIQTDLAKTLQTIAANPRDFYRGQLAQAIVTDMQAHGGIITIADLNQYRPIWRSPVCGDFAVKIRVCSMPPPSSGGIHLLQMLNLIDLAQIKRWGWHHPDTLHRMIESMRIAYADRATHLGDPDFIKVPVNALISPKYALKRRNAIDPTKATPSSQVKASDRQILQESTETSHLNVVDRDRNAVSLTFTVNLAFGSGVIAKGTGILLNNEMDDFAIAPNQPNAFGLTGQDANAIAPRKTPLSSMTPTIVTQDGKLRLAIGSPGGSTIITTVLQILLNTLVYEMDMNQAIAAPRLHHQWLPDQTRIDRWSLDPLTLQALKGRGHNLVERESWGNANGIQVRSDGRIEGAADPRGEGTAAGY
jgi:gamma-glutamyltranspeptidase / glutathione hydrolase